MGRPTYKGYVEGIKAKTGKSQDDFWKMAVKKRYIKNGEMAAKYGELLKWLRSDVKLGHVHASFVILSLRLRAKDPTLKDGMKRWAMKTGYKTQR